MDYLIVGNGAAAVGGVEGIRSLDPDGRITLLAAEEEPTYSRPLISYLLAGKVEAAEMGYRPADFYDACGVRAYLGTEVTAVRPERRAVETRDGPAFPYGRLLLATGGRPVMPDIGADDVAEGLFTFTGWADARAIEDHLGRHTVRQAVVLGGGMIGLKAAEALVARGLKVTVVELADRLLSPALDETAARMVEAGLRRAGADVCLGTTIEKVQATRGAVRGVRLATGGDLYCELLVVAVGVAPNVGYLASSGIETERGILVDEHLRTSGPNVYAAGDCAEAWDRLLGRRRPIPILPLAYRQGMVAGRNMAGVEERYPGGMAMNAVEVCDVPTISIGHATLGPEDGCEVLTDGDPGQGTYKRIVLRDRRIVGALFVGDVDRAGIYTGLIENRVDVESVKPLLLSSEFGLLSVDPEYRKHVVSGPGIEV